MPVAKSEGASGLRFERYVFDHEVRGGCSICGTRFGSDQRITIGNASVKFKSVSACLSSCSTCAARTSVENEAMMVLGRDLSELRSSSYNLSKPCADAELSLCGGGTLTMLPEWFSSASRKPLAKCELAKQVLRLATTPRSLSETALRSDRESCQ